MTERIAIYEFTDAMEARLARDALDDAGFEVWMERVGGGPMGEGRQRFQVFVPAEDADEARAVLTEPLPELEVPDDLSEELDDRRRPTWIQVVAAIVLIGFVITYAVQYDFLWPWILLVALVGLLLWRAAGGRRPS